MPKPFLRSKETSWKLVTWVIISIILLIFIVSITVGVISYSNTITPDGIIIHHSAVPFSITSPNDISIISNLHQKRGFSIFYWGRFYYIGYHYIILPNGTIVEARPMNVRGAHSTGRNSFIGICLIGDFSEKDNPHGEKGPQVPTNEQIKSLIFLTKKLKNQYQITMDNIVQHKSVESKTECPGDKFPMKEYLSAVEN